MFKEYLLRTGKLDRQVRVVDYSDENGFEFGFTCDHCGFEWRSERIPFKLSGFSENLDETDRELLWNDEKRRKFEMIFSEAVIEFNKCPECGAWVCDDCFFVDEGELTDFCIECIEELKH
jgi:predicted Zn-ribbon and HTH transcriptional regulator